MTQQTSSPRQAPCRSGSDGGRRRRRRSPWGSPRGPWLVDTDDGNLNTVSRALVHALIGDRFGVKRFSPGMIDVKPGVFPGDAKKHVVTHEATTLGGSSGSGLMAKGTSGAVMVGLHYAGIFGTRNYAHWVPAIREPLQ